MRPPLAVMDKVGVRFGRHVILDDVSLSVAPGEIVTLVGPNGAGKTTLLRVLLGLQAPSGGRAFLAPGTRIGYLPQRLAIDDTLPLTVRRLLGLARPRRGLDIDAALAEVGIPDAGALPVQALSGGELQRALLARALLREPDLLVLDEPVQGVDVTGQGELYALIRRIRDRRGCGVLLVSHDLHLVMAASDHVVCLNRHVCCSGHPDTVSRHPAYRALFGDAIAVYAHHHDHVHGPGHVHEIAGEGAPPAEGPVRRDGTDG